jgi:ABC-type transport system involved in multi-copper enzyme maturation permease subunit
MKGRHGALLARALGRISSDRTAVVAGLIAILLLGMGATVVASGMAAQSGEPAALAAALRGAGWSVGSGAFDFLLSILAVVMGLTFLDRDRKAGTVFGVLARPVSRTSVFLTSWLAVVLLLSVLDLVRSGTLIAGAAWLEGGIAPLHVLGAIAGLTGTWLLLTVFFTASAVLRPGYAALLGIAGLYLSVVAFRESAMLSGPALVAVNAICAVLPLAARQSELVSGAVQGTLGHSGPVVEAILYRISWIVLLLFVGAFAYSRRDVTPRG